MPRWTVIIAVAAGTAALAACTEWGAGPTLTGGTQNNVSVRYDATEVDPKDAEDVARTWCRWYGREARLRSRFALRPQMTYADYNCFDPATAAANAKQQPAPGDAVPVLPPPPADATPSPAAAPPPAASEPGAPTAAPRPAVDPGPAPVVPAPAITPPRSPDTVD